MSGALIERVRLSAYLVLAALLGSVVWILDAAWGWSAGGWLTLRFGFHDSIASGVVHGVAGAFTLGVLFHLGPRIGKYTKEGLGAAVQTAQPPHHRARADADLHRLLRVLRRVPGDRVDLVPGLGEHLPEPDDARLDHDGDHDGLRRRLHRRLLREPGRPVLDDLRRPRRRDRRVRRRGRLRADARLPALDAHRGARRLRRRLDRDARSASTTRSARSPCTGARASSACCGSGSSPPATRPASTTSSPRSAASSWAWRRSCRWASCRGWVAACVLRKAQPPARARVEVELEGLDIVEYGTLVYPGDGRREGADRRARRHARGDGDGHAVRQRPASRAGEDGAT